MADFSHAEMPRQSTEPRLRPDHLEGDLTHHRHGVLGDMAVVPDDYARPMPAGAVRETDYQRMAAVYSRINGGQVDRPRFGSYHELVHAYHNNRGDAAQRGGSYAQCTDYSAEIGDWELQAVGLGPYAAEAVSENTIRAQMGIPLRPTYGSATYHSPNPWAQRKDDEEPPLRSPHR